MLHSTDVIVHVMNSVWFLPDMALHVQVKKFSCLLANSKYALMCLLLSSGFSLAALPYRPDWWSAAQMVVLTG